MPVSGMSNFKNLLLIAAIGTIGLSLLNQGNSGLSQDDLQRVRKNDSILNALSLKISALEREVGELDEEIYSIKGTRSSFFLDLNQLESKIENVDDRVDDLKGIFPTRSTINSLESEIEKLKDDSHTH